MNDVSPRTFMVGFTDIDLNAITEYLKYTGNESFLQEMDDAAHQGVSDAEILCSMYAKLCYKSLSTGANKNVSRTRSIQDNLAGCFNHGHGSVFEHAWVNFITTDCSRVFTHEIVRHRIGTAFSQTSGRYVRSDQLDMVLGDPILSKYNVYDQIKRIAVAIEDGYVRVQNAVFSQHPDMPMAEKKRLTSALRRILPNGQGNEIGWSANFRAIRHLVQLRTSRHAEWEIRCVFNDVYRLCKAKFPLMFYGAKEETVDGLLEVSGMRMQPYDTVNETK